MNLELKKEMYNILKEKIRDKKLNYKIILNDNVSSKDKGKVVGQYSADDGVNEFTGSLIMR